MLVPATLLLLLDVINESRFVLSLSQVHRVFSQGAASQEGTMNRGDFLLSVNGASLAGLAHGDVLKVLHQAQLHRDVLVVIKKGNDQPRPSTRQEPPTSNGKGLLSRKTIPMEPGVGKTAVHQPAGCEQPAVWTLAQQEGKQWLSSCHLGQRNFCSESFL